MTAMSADLHPHAREWVAQGTALILDKVARFDDAAFVRPSGLPGWTRSHLLAHLAANAEALHRLTRWAATGEPSPMYASREQRDGDIERGAELTPARIREWLGEAVVLLGSGMDALSAEAWRNPVSTAQGTTVPATEIPWMRTRELWVHAVDLDADVDFADFPAALRTELIADVTSLRSTRQQGPELLMRSTDSDDAWRVAGAGPVVTVSGTRADLARWVTGRGSRGLDCGEDSLPELGAWL
jgi:maleylpyruvate isomerase